MKPGPAPQIKLLLNKLLKGAKQFWCCLLVCICRRMLNVVIVKYGAIMVKMLLCANVVMWLCCFLVVSRYVVSNGVVSSDIRDKT